MPQVRRSGGVKESSGRRVRQRPRPPHAAATLTLRTFVHGAVKRSDAPSVEAQHHSKKPGWAKGTCYSGTATVAPQRAAQHDGKVQSLCTVLPPEAVPSAHASRGKAPGASFREPQSARLRPHSEHRATALGWPPQEGTLVGTQAGAMVPIKQRSARPRVGSHSRHSSVIVLWIHGGSRLRNCRTAPPPPSTLGQSTTHSPHGTCS